MTTRFDESLPQLVEVLANEVGLDKAIGATYLRDAGGKLSVIVDASLDEAKIAELQNIITEAIGNYAREDGVVRDRDDYGAERLLAEGARSARLEVGPHKVKFLDRRTVGADWLLPPEPPKGVPRIAFASLKGGVGRSTALAVVAAYLSSRGLRVLAVDLDLEAPGIGTMLIHPDVLPKYGTLDYLVENGISGIDDRFALDCIGNSFLGETGAQVSVMPAVGTSTIANPAGAISKLSRAYLEDLDESGRSISLTGQIREMLDRVNAAGSYDVILIDARAGLHETTAAALLGLGAEMLLFGANEPQTFLGYRLLLAHLASLHADEDGEWRDRVQFVQAKATGNPDKNNEADNSFRELFSILTREVDDVPPPDYLTEDDFEMVWAEDELDIASVAYTETSIIRILDDERYRGFDPVRDRDLLDGDMYTATYGELLNWVDAIVPALAGFEDGI